MGKFRNPLYLIKKVTYLLKYVEYLMVIFMLKKVTFCQLQKKEQILNLDRVNGWTGGLPSQRVRADGRITISKSTGGSPIEIFREEGQIVISESTGGTPAHSKRADRWIVISESTGRCSDW